MQLGMAYRRYSPSPLQERLRGRLQPIQPVFGDFGFHRPDSPSTRPADNARYTRFQRPFETPRLQRLSYAASSVLLRYPFQVQLLIDPQDLQMMQKTIPPEAGNILVGPHPDVMDGLVLYQLFDALQHPHDALLMASDQMSRWLLPFFRCLKVLGVHRGNANSEANQQSKDYVIDRLTQGGWAGLLSEGCVSWGRQMVEMRKGAVEMAMKAALKANDKPIYITPIAMVYFHSNPVVMGKQMERALQDLEELPQVYACGKPKTEASFQERLEKVAHRLLDHKAAVHGVSLLPDNRARGHSVLKRILFLKSGLQKQLERRYGEKEPTEAEALWLMNLRGRIQQRLGWSHVEPKRLYKLEKQLNRPWLSPEQRRVVKAEIAPLEKLQQDRDQLERDLARVTDFKHFLSITTEESLNLKDPENQATLLRKLREMMQLKPVAFGPREAVVKILPPLKINDYIPQYQQADSETEKDTVLVQITRKIQQEIQQEIHRLVAKGPSQTWVLPVQETSAPNTQANLPLQATKPVTTLKQPV